jgi:phage terminase large subunit
VTTLTCDLPRKHRDALLAEHTPAGKAVRWRVLKGGRDGAKSHSIAKMLLLRGRAKTERILCVREIQNSIADSVHKLLSDQINLLGLGDFYGIFNNKIVGSNGTEILFHGLSGQTAASIKSFEGTTICWIEEAQTVSARSLDILIPTIRADGSEIWVSYNPEMDDDAVHKRLVTNQPDDAIVAHVNYTDNPWRSKALDSDREQMERTDPEKFAHVYGGATRPAVQGAIYYREVSAVRSSGRMANVPYDPMLKVHVVADLGYNDFMSLIFVQRLMSEIRVIRYLEDRQRDIPSYSQEMRGYNYNYGTLYLPHDARAKTLTSVSNPLGATAQEQFEKLSWKVEIVQDIDVEQGIRKTREVFPRVAFDKTLAAELVNRLGRYRRRVDKNGQAHAPVHDDQSHGSDGMRYTELVADLMSNDATPVITDPYAAFRGRRHG